MSVKNIDREELFRQMASQYVDQYGQELKRELAELEQSKILHATPSLDRRVRQTIAAQRRKRYTRLAGLLAACILLFLLVPNMGTFIGSDTAAPSTAEAEAESSAPAEVPQQEDSAASTGPEHSAEQEFEVIPLSFELPPNLSVAGFEQDNEKSIYYLSDTRLDDVVMTMEKAVSQEDYSKEGLVEISINQHKTYGRTEGEYSLLTFEKEEIRYVMTCKHDINTLVSLGGYIL